MLLTEFSCLVPSSSKFRRF